MVSKNRGIYRVLCLSQVLIIMVPRKNRVFAISKFCWVEKHENMTDETVEVPNPRATQPEKMKEKRPK